MTDAKGTLLERLDDEARAWDGRVMAILPRDAAAEIRRLLCEVESCKRDWAADLARLRAGSEGAGNG